ncbi:hypothetical protein ABBQ32_013558 [Trebouxia sp. C0010 RCD-2024]
MAVRLPQADVICCLLGQKISISSLRTGAYTLDYPAIGWGAFGVVHLATLRSSGQQFACKKINKWNLDTVQAVEAIQMEFIALHLVAGHPGVANLIEAFEDQNYVYFILELCSQGNLYTRITQQYLPESLAAAYWSSMVKTTAYLHQLGLMHRDLKPDNFLLTSNPDAAASLKVADFGCSALLPLGATLTDIVGNVHYRAPEVQSGTYAFAAEMWSLGVTLHNMLSGSMPCRDSAGRQLIFSANPWPGISDEAKHCVSRLLEQSEAERATLAEMLQHPWLVLHGVAVMPPLEHVIVQRMRQVAIQASGCSEMSADQLNDILMGLGCGHNQLVGCWEFVAAAISPVKMRTKGCFLQVCGLMTGFNNCAVHSTSRCAQLLC